MLCVRHGFCVVGRGLGEREGRREREEGRRTHDETHELEDALDDSGVEPDAFRVVHDAYV